MPDMPDLIGILESFNRKERFFLVAQALGNPKFELSTGFREKLAKAVDLEPGIEIPANAFAAMDYHLNWVHASLVLAHYTNTEDRVGGLNTEAVEQNQEDVDLLVAFKDASGDYHLIFIEAKGYNTDGMSDGLEVIDNGQLKSKADRLDLILKPYPAVKHHFCLMSGKKPANFPPKWENWLELSLPPERLVARLKKPRVLKSRKDWKGRPEKSRQIIPPKGTV